MEDLIFKETQLRIMKDGKFLIKDYKVGHLVLDDKIYWKCPEVIPEHIAKLLMFTQGFNSTDYGFFNFGSDDKQTLWESDKKKND